MATEAFTQLITGDIAHAIFTPFTSIMGVWIYGIIFTLTLAMLWIKTQNAAIPLLAFIVVFGCAIVALPPLFQQVSVILFVFGVSGMIYALLKGRG